MRSYNCPGVILIAAEIPTITYMFLYSAVDFSVYLLYKIFVCVNVWMKAELLLFVSNVTFGLVTKINKYWVNKVLFMTKSYKQRDKSWYDSITCIFPCLTMRKFSGQSPMNRGHQVVEQIKCAVINTYQSTESTERWHLRFTLTIERQYRYIKEYIWFIY